MLAIRRESSSKWHKRTHDTSQGISLSLDRTEVEGEVRSVVKGCCRHTNAILDIIYERDSPLGFLRKDVLLISLHVLFQTE